MPLFSRTLSAFEAGKSKGKLQKILLNAKADVIFTPIELENLTTEDIIKNTDASFIYAVQHIIDRRTEMQKSIAREEDKKKLVPRIKLK